MRHMLYGISDIGIGRYPPLDVNISGNKVFTIQSGFVPDGFLYSSSHKHVASTNKDKTGDENQVVIRKHAIRNCYHANYPYNNYQIFVFKYI